MSSVSPYANRTPNNIYKYLDNDDGIDDDNTNIDNNNRQYDRHVKCWCGFVSDNYYCFGFHSHYH